MENFKVHTIIVANTKQHMCLHAKRAWSLSYSLQYPAGSKTLFMYRSLLKEKIKDYMLSSHNTVYQYYISLCMNTNSYVEFQN